MPSILLVDDNPHIREGLKDFIEQSSRLKVFEASQGREAIEATHKFQPSAVLLDLSLPDMPGVQVLETLKNDPATCGIPILVFTAHHHDGQLLELREIGADGYLVKGGPWETVLGYLQVLIESNVHNSQQPISVGPVTIDAKQRSVSVDNQSCQALTPKEFDLLLFIASRSPEVLTWEKLSKAIWNEPAKFGKDSKTIELHAQRIRRKMGAAGRFVITHKGVGLQFVVTPSFVTPPVVTPSAPSLETPSRPSFLRRLLPIRPKQPRTKD